MRMPGPRVVWPQRAVTVMLLGGQDFFRGNDTADEYLNSMCSSIPAGNLTTAMLYLPKMGHIPQKEVLAACLVLLVRASLTWQLEPGRLPAEFAEAMAALEYIQFDGRLRYTTANGWMERKFGPQSPDIAPSPLSPRAPRPEVPLPKNTIGTAPAVVPVVWSVKETPEAHREFAEHARAAAAASHDEAQRLEVEAATLAEPQRQRYLKRLAYEAQCRSELLIEVAAGQEGEAYAQESDMARNKLQDQMDAEKKQRQASATALQNAALQPVKRPSQTMQLPQYSTGGQRLSQTMQQGQTAQQLQQLQQQQLWQQQQQYAQPRGMPAASAANVRHTAPSPYMQAPSHMQSTPHAQTPGPCHGRSQHIYR